MTLKGVRSSHELVRRRCRSHVDARRAFDERRQASTPRRRILLCYDGSAKARRALERVREIASAVPSRVTVVSVAEPIHPNPPYTGYADPGEEQAKRLLLGSVSAEVVVEAPCDVLVVR